MHKLSIKTFIFLHRLFKLFGKTLYFTTSTGIKALNKPPIKVSLSNSKVIYIPTKQLYLGFDGLKDSKTLLDTNIKDSPHFEMMKLLSEDKSIKECNYIKREQEGSLDGRYDQIVNTQTLEKHYSSFRRTISKEYLPIVYHINNKYYILDGKHRISKLSLQHEVIQCICIEHACLQHDKYTIDLHKICSKHKDYSINFQHLNYIFCNETDSNNKPNKH